MCNALAGEIHTMISVTSSIVFAFSTLLAAGLPGGPDTDGDGVPDVADVCCATPQGIPVDAQGRPWGDIDQDCDVDLEDFKLLQASFTGPLSPPSCCSSNNDCEMEDYCFRAIGTCDVAGACSPVPILCPDVYDPVCGCDGATYGNSCQAAAAGVSIDHEGVCIIPCDSNSDCASGDYCSTPQRRCTSSGECIPAPTVCPVVLDPVCGCDGVTYDNSCKAAAAGTSVDTTGECPVVCQGNNECAVDEYCRKGFFDCFGVGECASRPTRCFDSFSPRCGCDGITYDNICLANMAGVSVERSGACVEVVCASNDDCDITELCSTPAGTCGGSGVCAPRPAACPAIYLPVCGCDGTTYENKCKADEARVSVDYDGECIAFCNTNFDCGAGEFCKHPIGYCVTGGVCAPQPAKCPAIFAPVCGCDRITYENECLADQAGTSVGTNGTCP